MKLMKCFPFSPSSVSTSLSLSQRWKCIHIHVNVWYAVSCVNCMGFVCIGQIMFGRKLSLLVCLWMKDIIEYIPETDRHSLITSCTSTHSLELTKTHTTHSHTPHTVTHTHTHTVTHTHTHTHTHRYMYMYATQWQVKKGRRRRRKDDTLTHT